MRWLVLGNLTPAVTEALIRHGHTASTLAQAEIPENATPYDILAAAHKKQLDVLTNLPEIANAPFEQSIRFIRTLVFLQLKGEDVEQDDAVDRLFARYKSLSTARLYTVTETRVKVRQLPARQ
jgi:hypothetical protein